jgi:hypothetical protein
MGQGDPGLTIAIFAATGLYICAFSTQAKDQSPALECSIGGQERPEVVLVDPTSKSVTTANRTLKAEVTAQSITWKEDGTVRMIDRSTGAVLHRLPDESYFRIGQRRSKRNV